VAGKNAVVVFDEDDFEIVADKADGFRQPERDFRIMRNTRFEFVV
jgi:hypothetical protein